MRRVTVSFLLAALAAGVLTVAGCGGSKPTVVGTTTTVADNATPGGTITLLGSSLTTGPFGRSLSLKLVDGIEPVRFSMCAGWSKTRSDGCRTAPGTQLPIGSIMRLEQRPAGPGLTHPDSPGWGTVATSDTPDLHAVLSNGVTGNKLGKVTYRVTLHSASGRVLAASNTFTLTWHK